MHPDFDTVIIGAGFSGLGLAIRLRASGRGHFVLLEASDRVGGTWRENTYPGCACDVPSPLYSFSFELNPHWSRMFAPQKEILSYLEGCVEKNNLAPQIRFEHRVTGLRFDEKNALWWIDIDQRPSLTARHVALGVGGLHHPSTPQLPGLSGFEGPSFHSATYDHSVALEGKRVAVVGTGASAIQLVPELAKITSRLDLYQRTPPWVMHRPDKPFSASEQKHLSRHPWLRRLLRYGVYWYMELRGVGFTLNPRIMNYVQTLGLKFIASQVSDPELRAQVTPDYQIGCKRILMSNTYYPALQRPNVDLITQGIERISARGIIDLQGRERAVDAIIFATGFKVADYLSPITVRGLEGRDLNEAWSGGAQAYLGTMVSGFPNLYLLMGPNTGLGHNSMVFMLESQLRFILDYMQLLNRRGVSFANARSEAQDRFNAKLQARLRKSVWHSGCQSWYLDVEGNNATLWPGFTFEYWWLTRRARGRDFDGLDPRKRPD